MRHTTIICGFGLLGIGAFALLGCSEPESVATKAQSSHAQALNRTDPPTNVYSMVAFGTADSTPVCTGVAVANNLLLTSRDCVSEVNAAVAAGGSFWLGRTPDDGSNTFVYQQVESGDVNSTILGRVGFVHVRDVGDPFNITPIAASAPLSSSGTLVGVQATGQPAQATLVTIQSASPEPNPEGYHCLAQTFLRPDVDDGIPLFTADGSGLLGIGVAHNSERDGNSICAYPSLLNPMDFIPAERLPRIGTGQFTANAPYTWVLGGGGPFYEVGLFFPDRTGPAEAFTADTGIPKALPALFPAPTQPWPVFVPNNTTFALPSNGNADLVFTVAEDPTQATDPSDGTLDEDDTGVLTLRADLGMSFVLSDTEIVTLDGGGNIASVRPSYKGLPSADGSDGRFLTIGGQGYETAQNPTFRAYLTCPTGTPFNLEIFDGDAQGTFDAGTDATTCMRLVGDRDKSGADQEGATCTVRSQSEVAATMDAQWFPYDTGGVAGDSCADNATTGMSTYRFEVFVQTTGACLQNAPPFGSAVPPGVLNNFKVRSNCDIELDLVGAPFTFMAVDAAGSSPFYMAGGALVVGEAATTYEHSGGFGYVVDVSQAESEAARVVLENLDADDCDHPDGCMANGRSRGIHFLALSATSALNMSALEPTPGWALTPAWPLNDPSNPNSLRNQNPSGNFNLTIGEVTDEAGKFAVPLESGLSKLAVLWRNVRTINSISMLPHHGSPILFPALSNSSVWHPTVRSSTPATWAGDTAALAATLPFEIGDPGGRQGVQTVAEAQALLGGDDLAAELAAAFLNVQRASAGGMDLQNAVIRGTNVLVSTAIKQGNQVLAGTIPEPSNLRGLLRSVNRSLVLFSFPNPELAGASDDDNDGFPTYLDNCPTVYNPDQTESAVIDGLGDACDPIPIVECVVKRSSVSYTAFFGYDNPYRIRRLQGDYNRFLSGPPDRGQPSLQLAGRQTNVFSVDFNGLPITWQLAGNTATASSSSPRCTGTEITDVRISDNVALLASDRIELWDRVRMGNSGTIAAGPGGITVGHDGAVADAFSEGNFFARDRFTSSGSIRANGSITLGWYGEVAGLQIQGDSVDVDSLGLSIPPPAGVIPLSPIPHDGSLTLPAGNYGPLLVNDRATLCLSAGTYDFTSLSIGNDARIVIDDSAGLVKVVVRNSLTYRDRASVTALSGQHPQLLLQYLGTLSMQLFSSFAGSLYAPYAQVELVRGSYEGTFFAKRIIVQHDIRVDFEKLVATLP